MLCPFIECWPASDDLSEPLLPLSPPVLQPWCPPPSLHPQRSLGTLTSGSNTLGLYWPPSLSIQAQLGFYQPRNYCKSRLPLGVKLGSSNGSSCRFQTLETLYRVPLIRLQFLLQIYFKSISCLVLLHCYCWFFFQVHEWLLVVITVFCRIAMFDSCPYIFILISRMETRNCRIFKLKYTVPHAPIERL